MKTKFWIQIILISGLSLLVSSCTTKPKKALYNDTDMEQSEDSGMEQSEATPTENGDTFEEAPALDSDNQVSIEESADENALNLEDSSSNLIDLTGSSADENSEAQPLGEEDSLPKAEEKPDNQDRDMASSEKPFKQGMYDFGEDCKMQEEPVAGSNAAGIIRAGKTLWVEPFDQEWHRVYKKSGPVFIKASCL